MSEDRRLRARAIRNVRFYKFTLKSGNVGFPSGTSGTEIFSYEFLTFLIACGGQSRITSFLLPDCFSLPARTIRNVRKFENATSTPEVSFLCNTTSGVI